MGTHFITHKLIRKRQLDQRAVWFLPFFYKICISWIYNVALTDQLPSIMNMKKVYINLSNCLWEMLKFQMCTVAWIFDWLPALFTIFTCVGHIWINSMAASVCPFQTSWSINLGRLLYTILRCLYQFCSIIILKIATNEWKFVI